MRNHKQLSTLIFTIGILLFVLFIGVTHLHAFVPCEEGGYIPGNGVCECGGDPVNSRGMRATRSRAYGARESVENTWFLQLLEIDLGSPETAIRVPVSAQFERCFMVI